MVGATSLDNSNVLGSLSCEIGRRKLSSRQELVERSLSGNRPQLDPARLVGIHTISHIGGITVDTVTVVIALGPLGLLLSVLKSTTETSRVSGICSLLGASLGSFP